MRQILWACYQGELPTRRCRGASCEPYVEPRLYYYLKSLGYVDEEEGGALGISSGTYSAPFTAKGRDMCEALIGASFDEDLSARLLASAPVAAALAAALAKCEAYAVEEVETGFVSSACYKTGRDFIGAGASEFNLFSYVVNSDEFFDPDRAAECAGRAKHILTSSPLAVELGGVTALSPKFVEFVSSRAGELLDRGIKRQILKAYAFLLAKHALAGGWDYSTLKANASRYFDVAVEVDEVLGELAKAGALQRLNMGSGKPLGAYAVNRLESYGRALREELWRSISSAC